MVNSTLPPYVSPAATRRAWTHPSPGPPLTLVPVGAPGARVNPKGGGGEKFSGEISAARPRKLSGEPAPGPLDARTRGRNVGRQGRGNQNGPSARLVRPRKGRPPAGRPAFCMPEAQPDAALGRQMVLSNPVRAPRIDERGPVRRFERAAVDMRSGRSSASCEHSRPGTVRAAVPFAPDGVGVVVDSDHKVETWTRS